MSDAKAFGQAMHEVYVRARKEAGYNASRFLAMLEERGGLETARQLLYAEGVSDGFVQLWERRRLDLTVEFLILQPQWSGLFTDQERSIARRRLEEYGFEPLPEHVGIETLADLVHRINELAVNHPVGRLQDIRLSLKPHTKKPTRYIFKLRDDQLERGWTFHEGGRTELQFNVGEETFGETAHFRHGVAFSLEPSQTLPNPIEVLAPKIRRFNEFLTLHPGAYDDLVMWRHTPTGRTPVYRPRPIAPEEIEPGVFIFLGSHQEKGVADVQEVLKDFDRLLHLWRFVEDPEETFPDPPEPRRVAGDERRAREFVPGHDRGRRPPIYSKRDAQTVEVTFRHDELQDRLFALLERQHGEGAVGTEWSNAPGCKVDVAVEEGEGFSLYEVKTRLSARACIRDGLSQLLEYAYWPGTPPVKQLFIAGEPELDDEAREYLSILREQFGIPLHYRQIVE